MGRTHTSCRLAFKRLEVCLTTSYAISGSILSVWNEIGIIAVQSQYSHRADASGTTAPPIQGPRVIRLRELEGGAGTLPVAARISENFRCQQCAGLQHRRDDKMLSAARRDPAAWIESRSHLRGSYALATHRVIHKLLALELERLNELVYEHRSHESER